MDKFTASMFRALRASERAIVDGLLVKTFQLEGCVGGCGILTLEDGTAISFANQEIVIIGGYSAFRTEAEHAHSIDFIRPGGRGLSEADLRSSAATAPPVALPHAGFDLLQVEPPVRPR